jgi:hypothetical protein
VEHTGVLVDVVAVTLVDEDLVEDLVQDVVVDLVQDLVEDSVNEVLDVDLVREMLLDVVWVTVTEDEVSENVCRVCGIC